MRYACAALAAAILAIAAPGCTRPQRAEEMRCSACLDAADRVPGDACMKDGHCTICHPQTCPACGAAKSDAHACSHVKQCPDCGARHECSHRCPTCGKEKSVCPDCGK